MTDLLLSVSPWKPRRWPRGSHLHGTRVHSRAASLMAAGALYDWSGRPVWLIRATCSFGTFVVPVPDSARASSSRT